MPFRDHHRPLSLSHHFPLPLLSCRPSRRSLCSFPLFRSAHLEPGQDGEMRPNRPQIWILRSRYTLYRSNSGSKRIRIGRERFGESALLLHSFTRLPSTSPSRTKSWCVEPADTRTSKTTDLVRIGSHLYEQQVVGSSNFHPPLQEIDLKIRRKHEIRMRANSRITGYSSSSNENSGWV